MVTIILKSAETAKNELEPIRLKKEIEELKRQNEIEKKREQGIKHVIDIFMKKVQYEIENGHSWISKEIYYNSEIYNTLITPEEDMEQIKKIFELAGYEVHFHLYSNSWQYRSGKWGSFSIHIK